MESAPTGVGECLYCPTQSIDMLRGITATNQDHCNNNEGIQMYTVHPPPLPTLRDSNYSYNQLPLKMKLKYLTLNLTNKSVATIIISLKILPRMFLTLQ